MPAESLHPNYERQEDRAQQLDRNFSELIQELRVIGTGVQILFAFLLTTAFQARFSTTTPFQRDVYVVTLMLAATATAVFIAPVAVHRFVFRFRVKDELVDVTSALAIIGLIVLAMSMVGAVLLVADWVSGTVGAVVCGAMAAVVFGSLWFGLSTWLRRRAKAGSEPFRPGERP